MAQPTKPFSPRSATTNLAVLATAANITLPAHVGRVSVRLVNSGTQTVFIDFTTTATTTTSMPMFANTVEVFELDVNITTLSAIAGSTGSTLYATVGVGS